MRPIWLGHFDEIGEIEFWVANEESQGYCARLLFVNDRQTCPSHHQKSALSRQMLGDVLDRSLSWSPTEEILLRVTRSL